MSNAFSVAQLGPCHLDSPLESHFFVPDDTGILVDATHTGCQDCRNNAGSPSMLEKAGPRRKLFFDPRKTSAAIVTCGGLCPGLNDVVRGLTMVLWHRYGLRRVLGIRYGYEGLIGGDVGLPPLALDPESVADIHQNGGTLLGTSRGPQDVGAMVDYLIRQQVDILFPIGGDGTQRGAQQIAAEVARRGLPIAVVGVPKTIDNDVAFTERTFGFETAVAMSRMPIEGIHFEAKAVRNGVGLVKLMGRESGFVAAYATLATSDVNLVLVPEVPFSLSGVLRFLEQRLTRKGHAVVVVAEGAGQELASAVGQDASGNRKLGDIGVFLREAITRHFKELGRAIAVRYVDPSYTIRSARASADDSVFCFQLAGNAVHAAMAGRTAMVVGVWNGHFVHVPVDKAVSGRKCIDPLGVLWQSVLDNTGQPMSLL